MMLILLVYARLPWPRPRLAAAREIAGFGVPAALSGLCWTGFRNADFAIVGARLGTVSAGLYWRGYQLGIEYQRKVGSVVNQIVLPVYSRAPDLDTMLALRQRVVRVVSAILIPGLALLVVLAPTLVPWLFGSAWKEAVVPTQILAIAGIVTVPGDTVGAVVLAAGRARAWLVYHLGLFAVYATAIYVAAGYGLRTVCAAVVAVQALSTVAAYAGLMRGLVERPLLRLCHDLVPGVVPAAAVVATSGPLVWAFSKSELPTLVTMAVSSGIGAAAGAIVLHRVSRPAWNDLTVLARRMMGGRRLRLRRPTRIAAGVEPS
jgi:O-antigen/teichoic acid export membrane protein